MSTDRRLAEEGVGVVRLDAEPLSEGRHPSEGRPPQKVDLLSR